MSPEHHEERLRMWTISTGKPVLAIDYGKAPECESHQSNLDPLPKSPVLFGIGRSLPIRD